MRSQRRLLMVCCVCGLLLLAAACASQGETPTAARMASTPSATATASETPTPVPSFTPTPTMTDTPTAAMGLTPPTPVVGVTATPGLALHGRVHLADGSGVAGVAICRNYASYPGVVVATTGADGTFQADFAYIPGDEMVGVWAVASGYMFDPPSLRWRHYYGVEDREVDIVASPSAATAAPPAPCSQ